MIFSVKSIIEMVVAVIFLTYMISQIIKEARRNHTWDQHHSEPGGSTVPVCSKCGITSSEDDFEQRRRRAEERPW